MDSYCFPFADISDIELIVLNSSPESLLDSARLNVDELLNLSCCNATDQLDDAPPNLCIAHQCSYSALGEINSWPAKNNSLSILSINARSLNCNIDKIKVLLSHFILKPDIISLSETWLQKNNSLSLLQLESYDLISVPRDSKTKGGGVAIYVEKEVNYSIIQFKSITNNKFGEICAIELDNSNSSNIIIVQVYKPPNIDVLLFTDSLVSFLEGLKVNKKHLIVAGDFNIDLLQYHSRAPISYFLDHMLALGLLPSITLPTRLSHSSSTLIDNIFSNISGDNYFSKIIFDDISDHRLTFNAAYQNPYLYTRLHLFLSQTYFFHR